MKFQALDNDRSSRWQRVLPAHGRIFFDRLTVENLLSFVKKHSKSKLSSSG